MSRVNSNLSLQQIDEPTADDRNELKNNKEKPKKGTWIEYKLIDDDE